MRLMVLVATWALVASAASAQAPVQSWSVYVFAPGADPLTAPPTVTIALPAAVVTCSAAIANPPPATAPAVNPPVIYFTQPELPGVVCKADMSSLPAWTGLPSGGPYPLAMTFTNDRGISERTASDVPFVVVGPPSKPGTVRPRKQ